MATFTKGSLGNYYYGIAPQHQDIGILENYNRYEVQFYKNKNGTAYYIQPLVIQVNQFTHIPITAWNALISASSAYPYISTGVGIYDMRPTGGSSLQIYPSHTPNAVQPSVAGSRTIKSVAIKSDKQSPAPETQRGQIYPIHKPKYTKNDHIKYGYPSTVINTSTSALLVFARKTIADSTPYSISAKDAILKAVRRLQTEPSSFVVSGFDAIVVTYNLIGSSLVQVVSGQDADLLREAVLTGESLVQSVNQTDAVLDESTFFRDWTRQTYGWDIDFIVEWWAD